LCKSLKGNRKITDKPHISLQKNAALEWVFKSMVHLRSPEKRLERQLRHFVSYYDDEQRESISLENTRRLQLHRYRKGYETRFILLEEPVERGEVLKDQRNRGTLQINV